MTARAVFGFVGAWLLVGGPLYQGALELIEQQIDWASIQAAAGDLAPPAPPSAWWWLLPPVMLARQYRRYQNYQRAALGLLTARQRAQYTGFQQKATGWFVVAAGASCLAVQESWDLSDRFAWPAWALVAGAAAMFALVLLVVGWGTSRRLALEEPGGVDG